MNEYCNKSDENENKGNILSRRLDHYRQSSMRKQHKMKKLQDGAKRYNSKEKVCVLMINEEDQLVIHKQDHRLAKSNFKKKNPNSLRNSMERNEY